jgi:hypothetical protein
MSIQVPVSEIESSTGGDPDSEQLTVVTRGHRAALCPATPGKQGSDMRYPEV